MSASTRPVLKLTISTGPHWPHLNSTSEGRPSVRGVTLVLESWHLEPVGFLTFIKCRFQLISSCFLLSQQPQPKAWHGLILVYLCLFPCLDLADLFLPHECRMRTECGWWLGGGAFLPPFLYPVRDGPHMQKRWLNLVHLRLSLQAVLH